MTITPPDRLDEMIAAIKRSETAPPERLTLTSTEVEALTELLFELVRLRLTIGAIRRTLLEAQR